MRDLVRRRFGRNLVSLILVAAACWAQNHPTPPIVDYIRQSWSVLTRSARDIAKAAQDPKIENPGGSRVPVYVARDEDIARINENLRSSLPAAEFASIELRLLPERKDTISLEIPGQQDGLLYLPKPYVVPGARFNEMYGWDSYFIQLGLLHDGEIGLARDVTDNFLYEIQEYGNVLNANRTYYLTRSQPPFLTEMLLAVYARTGDQAWLAGALPAIEKYYSFWTSEPHLTRETGLSRYWDTGEGPAPEVLSDERDKRGRTHYDRVKEYFRTHQVSDYDVSQYYDRAHNELTPLFYKGDRSMRESGFDPSNRFGAFNIDVIHYNPVCLNILLYLMEMDIARILEIVGRADEASPWRERGRDRAERINRLMWDEHDGLYYDYDFVRKRVRHYPFLTTFYPLWAGIADKRQAAAVVRNLSRFERGGGLQTSTVRSGNQWDAPFGWAPLEFIAIQGLRRYGYNQDADRIAVKFLSLVREDYTRRGTIVEKYDVAHRSSNVSSIRFGYSANQTGFGWTNGVFVTLLDDLKEPARRRVLEGRRPQ